MIRKLQDADINCVADLWLNANVKAHDFISAQYWNDNFKMVKELLLQAEVYVYEEDHKILGFIGLNGEYIAGIFVSDGAQSGGIGRQLMDFVKDRNDQLTLHVYQKNIRAVQFYERENFKILREHTDETTGEKEYEMIWK